jgi:hypothetical protein
VLSRSVLLLVLLFDVAPLEIPASGFPLLFVAISGMERKKSNRLCGQEVSWEWEIRIRLVSIHDGIYFVGLVLLFP